MGERANVEHDPKGMPIVSPANLAEVESQGMRLEGQEALTLLMCHVE
jgi:hypothetical protein